MGGGGARTKRVARMTTCGKAPRRRGERSRSRSRERDRRRENTQGGGGDVESKGAGDEDEDEEIELVVLFILAYPAGNGDMSRFVILDQGGAPSAQLPVPGRTYRLEGVVTGQEPIPLYRRIAQVLQGATHYHAAQQGYAHVFQLQLIDSNAAVPALGEWVWGWWPQTASHPAGFYRGVIILKQ